MPWPKIVLVTHGSSPLRKVGWLLGELTLATWKICRRNAGNNAQCSAHRHRSLRESFSPEPFPASNSEGGGVLLRGVTGLCFRKKSESGAEICSAANNASTSAERITVPSFTKASW